MMEKIYAILNDLHPEFDYKDSDDYIEDGLLDSFDAVQSISELEEQFHITIDGLDILPENIGSIDAIVNLIRKSGGKI